jgi:hypothetical protein
MSNARDNVHREHLGRGQLQNEPNSAINYFISGRIRRGQSVLCL